MPKTSTKEIVSTVDELKLVLCEMVALDKDLENFNLKKQALQKRLALARDEVRSLMQL